MKYNGFSRFLPGLCRWVWEKCSIVSDLMGQSSTLCFITQSRDCISMLKSSYLSTAATWWFINVSADDYASPQVLSCIFGRTGGRATAGRPGWHWLNVCRWGLLISNHLGHQGHQGKPVGQVARGTAGIIGVRCLLQNQPIYPYVHVCVGMNARLCVPACPFANWPKGERLDAPVNTTPCDLTRS